MKRWLPAAAAVVLGIGLWLFDARAFAGCYLSLWWLVIGALMGGLANLWLHNLTGGRWGEPLRGPLLANARWVPLAALAFVPVLFALPLLYPWAAQAARGVARFAGELSAPGFKNLWLMPGFFIGRSVVYLVLWSALAWLARRPGRARSKGMAAAGLLLWMFSLGVASVDWIGSLQPVWSSSVFGWVAGVGQMLVGMALAILLVDRVAAIGVLPDLANLLLMYVMTWAYLVYVQFLIIWAGNLPHEITWYVQRSTPGWLAVAWGLAVLHCALPIAILLTRRAKLAPMLMALLAGIILAAHLLDSWWQVLPALAAPWWHWLVVAPGTALAAGLAWWAARAQPAAAGGEVAHA
jgi:hypothetical protein